MQVELLSFLQRAAGESRVDIDAATVRELLAALSSRYGETFRRQLLTADGQLKAGIAILINGRNINFLQGLDTPLNPRDKATIIPPAAGG
ncbi:MoaD family protein [Neomoorella thermoacetica]|uniref:ThiS family protein n=2 Tax=Neomoorella thermoacetica TaxID=1525 RepID=A0A1D7X919_NEOTH|nr:MoaD family protein [Moorella thermoacetica]AKX93467.1 ThiS family protein [Moorella thermoacetica]AKX96115.1 ThiS family protein [Moorella thermoacetica]AOQ23371.1 ThiS family protein [Moorella thermoacetica]APC07841.1 ThiS family protein [Moorella thermoacetica]OIQ09881.1 ThiS family protein [Moorella thermoacetica]